MNEGKHPGTQSLLPLILLAVLVTASFGQTDASIEGKWRTQLEGPAGRVVLIMELTQDTSSGQWTGDIRSARTPLESDELQALTVIDNTVRFHTLSEVPGQNITIRTDFNLQLRPTDDELRGSMKAVIPGMDVPEMPVTWTRIVEQAGAEGLRFQPSRPFIGAWRTQPDNDDRERELILEVLPDGDDYRGTLTDTGIDQTSALRDLVINDRQQTISFNYRFADEPFLSSFWGRYDEDRDRVRGSLSSSGSSQPLSFERTSPGPESLLDEFAVAKRPLVRKHDTLFAMTVRGAQWMPLYILKDNVRNINDITSSSFAYDAGVRFHLLDYLALQLRVMRGGLGFDTNERNLGLFDPRVEGPQSGGFLEETGIVSNRSYLSLDSYEFSLVVFLGQGLIPNSKFNPYLTTVIGRTAWELTEDGRGTRPISLYEVPLQGTDWTFGGGLGTEYALSKRFGLELEWVWSYTTTEDETLWLDVTEQWTSQHIFRFSLGGIFWF
jgi:opacity protein-like surface antigen